MSVFASTCYRGSSMLYVWVVYLQTVIRYKIIDKWFLNEFLHIMDHHLLTLEPKLIHIFTVSICQRDTETVHYMRSGNERRRRWKRACEHERKLVFDFKQCFINTNGIPQFVIRLSWLRPHSQKCLIKMIECQIMTWLFDNEAQIILWCHLFAIYNTTIPPGWMGMVVTWNQRTWNSNETNSELNTLFGIRRI